MDIWVRVFKIKGNLKKIEINYMAKCFSFKIIYTCLNCPQQPFRNDRIALFFDIIFIIFQHR